MDINLNSLRALRTEEGLKNPDDVYELTNRKSNDITPSFKESTPEALRHSIQEFIEDTNRAFQDAFQLLLQEYKKRKGLPSNDILKYLENHELDKPRFAIAERDGEGFLAKLGFPGHTLERNEIPLMFQLPKPLAQFWHKGGTESWGTLGQDIGPQITEWGHFYRELMEIVWEKIGYYESEKGLSFERVNDIGDHNPKSYYYVWKISRWVK